MPNPRIERRPLRSIFAAPLRASRVLRVLLDDPKRAWQVQQLVRKAKVSLGLASKVKQNLEYSRRRTTASSCLGPKTSYGTGAEPGCPASVSSWTATRRVSPLRPGPPSGTTAGRRGFVSR